MNRMNPEVDGYFKRSKKWRDALEKLRTIILDCQLTEELKWGAPCYTFQKSNIVIIQAFKEYYAIMFFKGALLKDASGILVAPGKNTQSCARFGSRCIRNDQNGNDCQSRSETEPLSRPD